MRALYIPFKGLHRALFPHSLPRASQSKHFAAQEGDVSMQHLNSAKSRAQAGTRGRGVWAGGWGLGFRVFGYRVQG